jgi:hypothetical protein
MSRNFTLATLIAAAMLTATARAHDGHADHDRPGHPHETAHQAAPAAAPLAGMDTPAPPLTAEYTLRTQDAAGKWSAPLTVRFIRSASRLVIEQRDFAESWRRVDNGFEFERVFHADRRTVEYTPGELRTLGIAPDWALLRSALDRGTIDGLTVATRGKGAHGDIVRYRSSGKKADAVRLDWLSAQQLPERLERIQGRTRSDMKLVRITPLDEAALAALDARADSYLRIDASDFGDMETDPFVLKVSRLDVLRGWRGSHGHAH